METAVSFRLLEAWVVVVVVVVVGVVVCGMGAFGAEPGVAVGQCSRMGQHVLYQTTVHIKGILHDQPAHVGGCCIFVEQT